MPAVFRPGSVSRARPLVSLWLGLGLSGFGATLLETYFFFAFFLMFSRSQGVARFGLACLQKETGTPALQPYVVASALNQKVFHYSLVSGTGSPVRDRCACLATLRGGKSGARNTKHKALFTRGLQKETGLPALQPFEVASHVVRYRPFVLYAFTLPGLRTPCRVVGPGHLWCSTGGAVHALGPGSEVPSACSFTGCPAGGAT